MIMRVTAIELVNLNTSLVEGPSPYVEEVAESIVESDTRLDPDNPSIFESVDRSPTIHTERVKIVKIPESRVNTNIRGNSRELGLIVVRIPNYDIQLEEQPVTVPPRKASVDEVDYPAHQCQRGQYYPVHHDLTPSPLRPRLLTPSQIRAFSTLS